MKYSKNYSAGSRSAELPAEAIALEWEKRDEQKVACAHLPAHHPASTQGKAAGDLTSECRRVV